MNKNLIVSGIVVLLICVGLSGCTESENESNNESNAQNNPDNEENNENDNLEKDFSIPSAMTIIYDEDVFEVYNLIVETWGMNASEWEKIADDIVPIPGDYSQGRVKLNGTVENIAGYEMARIDINEELYDENDDYIFWGGTTHHRNICNSCTFSLAFSQNIQLGDFNRPNHMNIEIIIVEE